MGAHGEASAYDGLAWFYNRYWGREYHRAALRALETLLLSGLPPGARVLDLCCGTGHLAAILAQRGYRIVGIDASSEMLSYAQGNVADAEFRVADARSFRLPFQCQAALSTFESMNHILSVRDLEAVFKSVAFALVQGSPFVFDVLTEEAYETLWTKSSSAVEEDNVLIVRGGYDSGERSAWTEITMFRPEAGAWMRSDLRIAQRCHEEVEIESLLKKAGFGAILGRSARDLGMEGDLAVGRTFFRAEKERDS